MKQAYQTNNDQIESRSETIAQNEANLFDESVENSKIPATHGNMVMVAAIGVAFILAILLGLTLSISITRQLGGEQANIESIADSVSKGYLTINLFSDRKTDTGIFLSIKNTVEKLIRINSQANQHAGANRRY